MSETDVPLVRSTGPQFRSLRDETVMFHPDVGKYFALDAVGSRVWELLERPATVDELCARLTAEFDVDAATCAEQVLALVADLRASQLVEEAR